MQINQCEHNNLLTEALPWAHIIIKQCANCDYKESETIEPINNN